MTLRFIITAALIALLALAVNAGYVVAAWLLP